VLKCDDQFIIIYSDSSHTLDAYSILELLQVDHYKSDWHRLNIRQKLKGRSPVTEAAFEQMKEGKSNHS